MESAVQNPERGVVVTCDGDEGAVGADSDVEPDEQAVLRHPRRRDVARQPCDTLFLLVSGDLREDGRRRRYSRFSSAPTRSLQGDRHASESVIGLSESVIGIEWYH